ncbi:MAG: hypothetical protein EBW31_00245 [Actinobacteria bacterium]|jgi:hypothetical protein|nr:hypothetical protein [Actinomycetota bacterium]NCV81405.1 hypothetical protein [Actinomycetota bacterium]NCV97969.1 hypothetical protein [Actinomycetota bacterium]NCW22521.1 hypothetical protein [Actinomycetota bacterium]NCW29532.1 hypothetical protein [Actinomycetota bacterium]
MSSIYYNCGNSNLETTVDTSSVRIARDLLEAARLAAKVEHRTLQGQLEYWARVGKAGLENPDLPIDFVSESLASLAEPRAEALPFTPRSS